MVKEIIFIAPDNSTALSVEEVANKLGLDIIVCIATGEERFDFAKKYSMKGAEVAVSRWGYSLKKAKDSLNLSIVNVEVNGYDITRTLFQVKEKIHRYTRVAVLHNEKVVCGFLELAPYINVIITFHKILRDISEAEIESAIKDLKNKKIDIVIAGLDILNRAFQEGIKGIKVNAGNEGIEEGLSEASRIIKIKYEEREEAKKLKTIIDYSHEGIITLDNNNYISLFNKKAGEILDINPADVITKNIEELHNKLGFISTSEGNDAIIEKMYKIRDKHIIFNQVPIYANDNKIASVINFIDTQRIINLETKARKELNKKGLIVHYDFSDIIGDSERIKNAITFAKKYSEVDASILIQGKTGTGKEIFAQSIHNHSRRKNGPFVAVNCAALPVSILESELFGYVSGAFTGAKKEGKQGLFELAHNGTIFLDEIGEIPLNIQTRFLRVIEEKRVIRLGGDSMIPINVRVISASNKDLPTLIERGKFREDLYYRLATLVLKIPNLVERENDVFLLLQKFIEECHLKYGKKMKPLSEDVNAWVKEHSWPGNVRELKNFAERIVLLSDKEGDLCLNYLTTIINDIDNNYVAKPGNYEERAKLLSIIEKESILKTLEQYKGNKKRTADALGISTTTLWRKLKRIEI